MNLQQFLKYMDPPGSFTDESSAQLADLVEQFPYCQTAHLLYLKCLHMQENIRFHEHLRIAAIHVANRKKMYELIMQPSLISKIKAIEEKTAGAPGESSVKTLSLLEKQVLEQAINATLQIEAAPTVEESEKIPAKISRKRKKRKNPALPEAENEEHSFNEWLKIISQNTAGPLKSTPVRESKNQLIDAFIRENPKIIPSKKEFFSPQNTARMSVIEDESFVTKTLAKIYVRQKKYAKAIRAYEILSLKYPKKKSIFAARISSIRQKMKPQ